MKQFRHIFAILVLAALCGCVRMESIDVPGREISFSVGNYAPGTKANAAVEFDYFTSKAFLHADGYENETQSYFGEGETISPNNVSAPTEWAPSHVYYWPKSSTSYINFVAWHDAIGAPTRATEDSLVWSGRSIGATDNILVADMAWRFQGNTVNGTQYTGDAITSGVPMLFHHMLSRVAVNVSASPLTDPDNSTTTYSVIIQSISLSSVYSQGTMILTNSDPGTSSTTRAWTPKNATYFWSTQGTAGTIGMSASTLTQTPAAALPLRSMLPQPLNDTALNITYTVVTYSNGTETTREVDIPATIKLNTIKNTSNVAINQWLPNRIYTYNLVVDPRGTEIRLAPVIESDWGTMGASATVE